MEMVTMRRVLGVACAVVVAWASTPAVGAPASAPVHNWVVVEITAGPQGAENVIVDIRRHVTPTGPQQAFGIAASFEGFTLSLVNPTSSSLVSVRTTRSLGGHSITLGGTFDTPSDISLSAMPGNLRPHQRLTLLMFYAGGHFVGPDVLKTNVEAGAVRANVFSGSGSHAWWLGDAHDAGVGAAAAGSGGGTVTHTVRAHAGLVGGLGAGEDLTVTSATWTAPHRPTRWASAECDVVDCLGRGASSFSGSSGAWRWTWTGVEAGLVTPNLLAAWAPVGRLWREFPTG
jgi:hypothetical protein